MIPIIITSIENNDDRDFMEALYVSYNRLMYSEIKKIVSDSWAVDDLFQTVLEKLIDKIQLLRTFDRPTMINYVSTASRNTAYNYLRDTGKINVISLDDEVLKNIAEQGEIYDRLFLQVSKEIVHRAWKALDKRNQWVLGMKYFMEKTDEEMSSELRIEKNSVRMTLTRARNALKAQILKLM